MAVTQRIMAKSDVNDLFNAVVHIGHRTPKWNPRMKPYLFGEKDGVHIINLQKTLEGLNAAQNYLNKMVSEGKKVLFVSTKPQAQSLIVDVANSCNMPYVTGRWIPGLLTNFSTVKTRIRYFVNLKEQEASGEFSKYTKKEVAQFKKYIDKLENSLGGVQTLTDLPDCVFVADVVRDRVTVKEANLLKIPIVGIVDSNADPSVIDYPIPGNDDALKSLVYLFGQIKEAVCKPKKSV